jgi:uncharacterized protein
VKAILPLALLPGLLGMPAAAQVAIPALEARVTDLSGTLTAGQQSTLEDKLQQFEARKGSQIAVLILPTTQPEDIAQFGIRLAEAWKIGRKSVDDGAILIVAKDDRTLRIEVGRGLEGALPDITAGRIINDTIAPLFRQGDFYGGVNAGLDQMIRVIDGEALPAPDNRWHRKPRNAVPWPFVVLGFLAFAGGFSRFGGRVAGGLIAGVCATVVVYWVMSRILPALGAGVVVFLLALMTGFGDGMNFSRGGSRVFRDIGRGGGFGGGFGGGSGGFGGGGGFRGGGGSFGGGGASGRW